MIETILAWLTPQVMMWAGGSVLVFIVGWILKKIPTDRFAKWAKEVGRKQGVAVTTFFNAKLPKLYNGVIEPVFIDTIDAVFLGWIRGFIEGLKSDNPE